MSESPKSEQPVMEAYTSAELVKQKVRELNKAIENAMEKHQLRVDIEQREIRSPRMAYDRPYLEVRVYDEL